MNLISQHTKEIMEECKKRAWDAGLEFDKESLEYIVTNQDMLELSPRNMIPTLYDYWVNDVRTLVEKGKYKLYPSNPYETVINTRPAVSFYNDNNPDWLNVMIFYHVLGHIDFFQNNIFFKHTWGDDFLGRARADKRLIARLRSEYGRWVDYVIEFARGIDNLLNYYRALSRAANPDGHSFSDRLDYYFDIFLQDEKKVAHSEYLENLDEYNRFIRENKEDGEALFFNEVKAKYPEFDSRLDKYLAKKEKVPSDLMDYILTHSRKLDEEENRWMKSVIQVVRDTSLYFEPQRRCQNFNEGWASFWHDRLFCKDERISGHEVDFARVHAKVTSLPRVGLNPYAIGMRLLSHIEELGDRGKISYEFQKTHGIEDRKNWDREEGRGLEILFKLREELCDFTLINTYVDQDFINKHDLFTVEKRLNEQRQTWQYVVKSRRAEDYRQMLLDSLWHPPHILIDEQKTSAEKIVLIHVEEGKPLVREFIANTLMGIEFLWGGTVELATTDMYYKQTDDPEEPELVKIPVVYTMKDRKLIRKGGG